jgi:hypothetical protein
LGTGMDRLAAMLAKGWKHAYVSAARTYIERCKKWTTKQAQPAAQALRCASKIGKRQC